MADKQFNAELERIVKVLSGSIPENFCGESMLRYYQLKYWLNDCIDDYESLRISAHLYAGFRLAWRLRVVRRNSKKSHIALLSAMSNDAEIRFLCTLWLPAFEIIEKRRAFSTDPAFSKMDQIHNSLDVFVTHCLHAKRRLGKKVIYTANDAYLQDCKSDANLLRDIDTHRRYLRARIPFLYVASRFAKPLMSMPTTTEEIKRDLNRHAGKKAAFKKLFARCAYVQSVFERGDELTGQRLASWARTKPLPFDIDDNAVR